MASFEMYPFSGGTSSIEVSRTARGEYTWGIKLYFLGSDMRTIKHIIDNITKTRAYLEVMLGQKMIDSEEMDDYEKEIKEIAEKASAEAKKKAEPKKQDSPI